MARKKDQAARREQLVSATIDLIADRGIESLTLAAIADRVGVSHRLVAYYYADLESLVQEAHEAAVERYYWTRLQALDQIADPQHRLLQLIHSGLPGQQDRQLSQVLNELSANASRSQVHAQLMSQLFDREVSHYHSVLQEGSAGEERSWALAPLGPKVFFAARCRDRPRQPGRRKLGRQFLQPGNFLRPGLQRRSLLLEERT